MTNWEKVRDVLGLPKELKLHYRYQCDMFDCDDMGFCDECPMYVDDYWNAEYKPKTKENGDVPDTNVGDMISRQAAIDALDKRFDNVPMELTTEILGLRRDLRERIPSITQKTDGDMISRKAVLEYLDELSKDRRFSTSSRGVIDGIKDNISMQCAYDCGKASVQNTDGDMISREAVMKLQTYKLGEDCKELLVARDDVLELIDSSDGYDISNVLDETDDFRRGYNYAKREIALSGEYERAYHRGFDDGRKYEWTTVAESPSVSDTNDGNMISRNLKEVE